MYIHRFLLTGVLLLTASACGSGASHSSVVDAGTHDGSAGSGSTSGGTDGGDSTHNATGGTMAGGGSAADQQLALAVVSHLKMCGAYPGAGFDLVIRDEFARCAANCATQAACSDIKDEACSNSPSPTNAYVACVGGCSPNPSDGFACGDGSKVSYLTLCDGLRDCKGGEDEANCPGYLCKNGEKLHGGPSLACDGSADCMDGSDEAGCTDICA